MNHNARFGIVFVITAIPVPNSKCYNCTPAVNCVVMLRIEHFCHALIYGNASFFLNKEAAIKTRRVECWGNCCIGMHFYGVLQPNVYER